MYTRTYRAKSMQEALELVRRDLGPDAAVLHTREVSGSLLRWMVGSRQIEVTASNNVNVPSRIQRPVAEAMYETTALPTAAVPRQDVPPADDFNYRAKFRNDLKGQIANLHSMLEELCHHADRHPSHELPESLFELFTDLIDAEVSEELARELIDRVRASDAGGDLDDAVMLKARIARMIEDEIKVCGPIQVTPGKTRLAALIGPTGVGKTTTIAKLAANFRLRDRHKVGLITVDTYRIAAVEQLRTYADIMDLPMEVVATPRELRKAVDRLSKMDVILLDTAGRSPRDDVKIQELKSMLGEARPDEVHLVLSVVANPNIMKKTAEQFAAVGATSLILTKLDEASGLGNLLPLLRNCNLPLSYTTNGQNVPDDISQADQQELAREILGLAN